MYNKGTEDGIKKHYLSIAESTNLPIILYNVPSRTGVNLGFNLLERLAEHPNIVALKEASDSIDRLIRLSAMGDNLTLYSGNDSQIFPTLSIGGMGVISVISNLIPRTVVDLCQDYFDGNRDGALRLQQNLLPFIRSMFIETNPSPIKYAMHLKGICSAEVRLPLSLPRENSRTIIEDELKKLDDITKK